MNVDGLPFASSIWIPIGIAVVACAIATYIFSKKDMFH